MTVYRSVRHQALNQTTAKAQLNTLPPPQYHRYTCSAIMKKMDGRACQNNQLNRSQDYHTPAFLFAFKQPQTALTMPAILCCKIEGRKRSAAIVFHADSRMNLRTMACHSHAEAAHKGMSGKLSHLKRQCPVTTTGAWQTVNPL